MAFRAGNEARKNESVQDTVGITTRNLHTLVGDFTRDFLNSDIDKLYVSILLYLVENKNEDDKDDRGKKIHDRLRGNVDCDVLKKEIDNLKKDIDINSYLLSILNYISDNKGYCFNPFVRKVCLGDTSVFAYDIDPVEDEDLRLTQQGRRSIVLTKIDLFKIIL